MPSRTRAPAARRADRHRLYEKAVQAVDVECEFVRDTFRKLRKRTPRSLREDFCGTAAAACEWVKAGPQRTAVGVDIDTEVLDWGRNHHVARLSDNERRRLKLIEGDVLTAKTRPVDVTLAMNFSYWIFRDRKTLKRYFRRVRDGLAKDGVFMLDAYGGHDAYKVMRERRDCGGYTYIWDQADYDPISGAMTCHIHFSFPDGSRMRRAFSYKWRLWSLPEIRELLAEAGFARSTVYWQGTDEETGEGNGEFLPAERGDPDPAWIAYIVAEK
jgi:hypothetical protein